MLGPFYKPDAPRRSQVGQGYVLQGVVRSAANCQPLANAMVEFWLAGPDGRYSDAYRGHVLAEETGHYTFESHRPPPYSGRPAHIHLRVTAAGHRVLVTQHYPAADQQQATFDLVLVPQ
jgi:protocatechuate 3,4-dioxygenase beta subunit